MARPAAFLCYARANDRDKSVTKLREALSAVVEDAIGEEFHIFQDHTDISWGQNWRERIEQALEEEATFLIAILSPSFFNSPECRRELEIFLNREKKLGRSDVVLPIYYVEDPALESEEGRARDPLRASVAAHQRVDWRPLRDRSLRSQQARQKLTQMAVQIRNALRRVSAGPASPDSDPAPRTRPAEVADPDHHSAGSVTEPESDGPIQFIPGAGSRVDSNTRASGAANPGVPARDSTGPIDFFISRNNADGAWAQWVAWVLEEHGHSVFLQDWHFRPGQDFVNRMQIGASRARHTLVILSEAFLAAEFTQPEWYAAFAEDPQGEERRLIPVHVQKCRPTGLLRSRIYIDLVGLDERSARSALLDGLRDDLHPSSKPPFPGEPRAPAERAALETPRFPGASRLYNVPERNSWFVGREEDLARLRTAFLEQKAAELPGLQALFGLGGVGKTQTALAYAHRYGQEYYAVLWLSASRRGALNADCARIAAQIGSVQSGGAPARVEEDWAIQVVEDWLRDHPGCLVVFDNIDEPERLRRLRPANPSGDCLLTSRRRNLQALHITNPIELGVLSPEEALAFLATRTNRTHRDLDAAEARSARALIEELGCLPLAIEQASAYILTNGTDFQSYLQSYRSQPDEVLEAPKYGHYDRTFAKTWNMSFDKVRRVPAAEEILHITAFLFPDEIPLCLIRRGGSEMGPALKERLSDVDQVPVRVFEVLRPLADHSLIHHEPGAATYSVHRLVQAVLRDQLRHKDQEALWAARVVRAVARAFPQPKMQNWPDCDRVIRHAQVCGELVDAFSMDVPEAGNLFFHAGDYLTYRGEFETAHRLLRQALAIHRAHPGEDQVDLAWTTNDLASLCLRREQYAEARRLYHEALRLRKAAFGPASGHVGAVLNNLGNLYREMADRERPKKRLFKARMLFLRALQRCKLDESAEATVRDNMAAVYQELGNPAEAENFYREALQACMEAASPDLRIAAEIFTNLGTLHHLYGDYARANRCFEDAARIGKIVQGPNHPEFARTLFEYARLRQTERDLGAAIGAATQAVTILEKQLGSTHRRTCEAQALLADLESAERNAGAAWTRVPWRAAETDEEAPESSEMLLSFVRSRIREEDQGGVAAT